MVSPANSKITMLFFFFFVALALIGVCAFAILRRKRISSGKPEGTLNHDEFSGWEGIKKMLFGSLRWSTASKWQGSRMPRWDGECSNGALWQRRILMGEKCELPRFSGVILYDEYGLPFHGCSSKEVTLRPEEPKKARTKLKDLL